MISEQETQNAYRVSAKCCRSCHFSHMWESRKEFRRLRVGECKAKVCFHGVLITVNVGILWRCGVCVLRYICGMCVYVSVCKWVHVHMCVWHQQLTLGIFLDQSLPHCLRQDLSLNLDLINIANCLGNEFQVSSI